MANSVHEIVRWKGLADVSDKVMKIAVEAIEPDLKTIGGFVSKSLFRERDFWVDIYIWKTREDAESSMDKMSGKASFQKLMSLVDPKSISLTILDPA
jgi:hypothetical protein